MPHSSGPPYRLRFLVERLNEEDFRRLSRKHGSASRAELVRTLSAPDGIRARFATLDATVREVFADACVGRIELAHAAAAGPARRLTALGLVFRSGPADMRDILVPAEVVIALRDDFPEDCMPVLAELSRLDEMRLALLLQALGLDEEREDASFNDPVGMLVATSYRLRSPLHLESLLDSLSPSARNLLLFASQWEAPIPVERVDDVAHQFAQRFNDPPGTRHVLEHFGLLFPVGNDRVRLPTDVVLALVPLLEQHLADRCAEAWDRVRVEQTPAFRDVFPRGLGGDPLLAFRYRVLRSLRAELDLSHPADDILHALGLHDAPDGDLHPDLRECLDTSGPESFSREILRIWLEDVHPELDGPLVDALGGHAQSLFFRSLESDTARAPDDVDSLLVLLHTHVIFTLGVLPPGFWFRLDRLAEWAVALYRKLAWRTLPPERIDEPALPLVAIEVTNEAVAPMESWLRRLFERLLEPLAAVRFDESRKLFMVNTEPLRVLRDEDPHFVDVWRDAESMLGDDIDLWLPRPIDHGPRTQGVAPFRWDAQNRLRVAGCAHFTDLLQLADRAIPELDGEGLAFRFTEASVLHPLHERPWWSVRVGHRHPPEIAWDDALPLWSERWLPVPMPPEEHLLWLTRRGGPVPAAVRGFYPLSSAIADGDAGAQAEAATRWLQGLTERLRWSNARQARGVLEAIRAWGADASAPVLDELRSAMQASPPTLDQVFYLSLLAGELGLAGATEDLQRLFLETEEQAIHEGACIALARIGEPAVPWLLERSSISNPDMEDRFLAVEALTILTVLHPHLTGTVVGALVDQVNGGDLEPEDATLLAMRIAETGHADAAQLIHQLHERQLWAEDILPLDEAIWMNQLAPAVHGRGSVAPPLAGVFNPHTTSELVLEFLDEWEYSDDTSDPSPPWASYDGPNHEAVRARRPQE